MHYVPSTWLEFAASNLSMVVYSYYVDAPLECREIETLLKEILT
jgi:hypothetical protein